MLTGLRLGNFKAFGPTQRLPIKPITLIFGPNSAGKSSIIHSLLLARHAFETGELDVARTKLSGDSVDLGGYHQYLFRHDESNHMEWGFEINAGSLGLEVSTDALPSHLEVSLGIWSDTRTSKDVLPGDEEPGRSFSPAPMLRLFEVIADGVTVLRLSLRADRTFRVDQLNTEQPLLRALFDAAISRGVRRSFVGDVQMDMTLAAGVSFLVSVAADKFLPSRADIPSESALRRELVKERAKMPVKQARGIAGTASKYGRLLTSLLTDLLGAISRELQQDVALMHYLGPLRTFPPRELPEKGGEIEDPNWAPGGASGWNLVRRDWDVRAKVNEWLGAAERLQTPYELSIRRYVDVESTGLLRALRPGLGVVLREFGDRLIGWVEAQNGQSVADYLARSQGRSDGVEELMSQDGIVARGPNRSDLNADDDEILAAPYVERVIPPIGCKNLDDFARDQLVLVDKRTGVEVSHRDIGIGISQVLPVLAMSYGTSHRLLAIEQPEIHLHPGLQAELADVFIASALDEGWRNTLLIETHSEHLILRVMRRMRETQARTLPEGIPPVHPADVAVLYVEPRKDGSLVRELPLNDRGELVKPWPGGFFEEGLRETLA